MIFVVLVLVVIVVVVFSFFLGSQRGSLAHCSEYVNLAPACGLGKLPDAQCAGLVGSLLSGLHRLCASEISPTCRQRQC
jgi:hypothetical protein